MHDERELPRQVVRVLEPAVHATRPVGRERVRRVAREHDPPRDEPVDDPLVEAVRAAPLDLVGHVADDAAHPPVELPRRHFGLDVRVRGQLPVDAPHVVGLRVHDDLPARVERRVVVEVPLLGQRQGAAQVGDEEAVAVRVARPRHRGEPAHGRADAVAPHEPRHVVHVLAARTVPCRDVHALGVLGVPDDLVPPERRAGRLGVEVRAQHLLDVPLRDVDERPVADARRVLVPAHLTAAHVRVPRAPREPACRDRVAQPEPPEDLQGVPLDEARLRPLAPRCGVALEHERLDPVGGEACGQRHPDRAGADHADAARGVRGAHASSSRCAATGQPVASAARDRNTGIDRTTSR